MKTLRILSAIIFSMAFAISVQAQSMLELHFGDNRFSLVAETTKLIDMSESTFDSSIGHNSPATPQKPNEENVSANEFMKMHILRIIGLKKAVYLFDNNLIL